MQLQLEESEESEQLPTIEEEEPVVTEATPDLPEPYAQITLSQRISTVPAPVVAEVVTAVVEVSMEIVSAGGSIIDVVAGGVC